MGGRESREGDDWHGTVELPAHSANWREGGGGWEGRERWEAGGGLWGLKLKVSFQHTFVRQARSPLKAASWIRRYRLHTLQRIACTQSEQRAEKWHGTARHDMALRRVARTCMAPPGSWIHHGRDRGTRLAELQNGRRTGTEKQSEEGGRARGGKATFMG